MDISSFYKLTLGCDPYPYQKRLAEDTWPDLLDIPTGLGKTAAIFMAWAYKRATKDNSTPRRLVWCLPMRVLVEQTASLLKDWSALLAEKGLISTAPSCHVLMGGQIEQDWDMLPEKDAVIVGTQDQLLSRALNRGYSMSRYRWPMDFAMLNNDAFWVFDEIQLMGPGLTTSAQLEALRARFGTASNCRSLWCSATLRPEWLKTVDFAERIAGLQCASLQEDDRKYSRVSQRICASKAFRTIRKKDLVKNVLASHRPGTLTLVIRNTVNDAVSTYKEIQKKAKSEVVLLHSRFRPAEKAAVLQRLLAPQGETGRIAVTTQVIEAGVDISAANLFTDLAPWPSMVQRFGRCNRGGEISEARIFCMVPEGESISAKSALPYTPEELSSSLSTLKTLSDASPASLPRPEAQSSEYPILRSIDVLDLFDTTPDLAGADIDISRFIRDRNESDAQVFWREISGKTPAPQMPAARREELCAVPVHELRQWITESKEQKNAWCWDALDGEWKRLRNPFPGMTVLLDRNSGGYDCECGWDATSEKPVPLVPETHEEMPASMDSDQQSLTAWQSIEEHSARVVEQLETLLKELTNPNLDRYQTDLLLAARFHDRGKAHAVFQKACAGADPGILWAKAPVITPYERRGFRHELASALAMLQEGDSDLSAYLAAAHHGKIRLSLRSMPNETIPPDATRFARGIWEGDELPAYAGLPPVKLSLSCMEIGLSEQGESWSDRMGSLLDDAGPFMLAYLEMLIRAADWRASA